METIYKELQGSLPVSNFYPVTLPQSEGLNGRKDYISFGISYIEHSSDGVFFSRSFVTSSPERKSEFAAEIKFLSDAKHKIRTLSFALGQLYEGIKSKEELCGLLEENMTDEEYERAFDEYDQRLKLHAKRPSRQTSSEIAEDTKIILEALGVELGSDEIAEMLNLDVMEVERVLQEYKLNQ